MGYFFIKPRALHAVKKGETMKAILGISTKMILVFLTLINIAGCDDASSNSGNSSSSGYAIVDTGQSACYDDNGDEISCPEPGEAFYGQDAQYAGYQSSYTENGDGTVTDNVTDLMWQQIPANAGLSWQEAVNYCKSLELAGYSDWRMPTLKELFSISDFSQGWPYLDTAYFSMAGPSVRKDEQYWADDYYVGTTVEGGVGSGMNWEDALAYAESSTLASYDDWRLPNVKELQSIVDYTQSPSAGNAASIGPAIDTDFFEITGLPSGSTDYSPDYGYYWTSTSAYHSTASPEYVYAWYVAFGTSPNASGSDFHGAGAVRFDAKIEGNETGEGDDERGYNYVRLVRDAY